MTEVEAVLWLLWIAAIMLLVPLLAWIALLWALAFRSRRPAPPPPAAGVTPTFLVIVPAHDEKGMIAGIVHRILAADYPRDALRLVVVADNCSDGTAEAAEAAGAGVLRRTDPGNPGKGQAIAHALEALKQEPCDAILFLDADSEPDAGYFRVMAPYVARGDRAVQGRYDVADPGRTWFTRLTSVSFVLRNFWQYPAMDALRLGVPLRGSGMCFAASLIRDTGWAARGLTEDTEMTLDLRRNGVRVVYAPQAVSGQFMPATPAGAVTQRLRWSAGERGVRAVLLRREIPVALRAGRWRDALFLCLLAAPPFSLQLFAALAAGFAAWLASPPLLPVAALAVALYAGYFCLGLQRFDRGAVAAVLMLPVFVLWRVGVHVAACLKKPASWIRTPRSDVGDH
ncbi:MAG: glycosyltransferase [Planctomycetota bacterium]|nr:glycosyltransferase [Planctomycetota bacterium]